MKQANQELRAIIKRSDVRYWQIADAMGISPDTFTRRMRHELTPEKKEAVLDAIETCKEKNHND